jgi:hypothetical protein
MYELKGARTADAIKAFAKDMKNKESLPIPEVTILNKFNGIVKNALHNVQVNTSRLPTCLKLFQLCIENFCRISFRRYTLACSRRPHRCCIRHRNGDDLHSDK